LAIVSANIRRPFDAMEVICRMVDGSRFSDFKPLYGQNMITGWAHIQGEINRGLFISRLSCWDFGKQQSYISSRCQQGCTVHSAMQHKVRPHLVDVSSQEHAHYLPAKYYWVHGWQKVRRGWNHQGWVAFH
jgi:hypothetical protein